MKIKKINLLWLLIMVPMVVFAQKNFQGKIVYKVEMDLEGFDTTGVSQLANMKQTIFFKGEKSRIEMDFGVANSITVSDAKLCTMVVLTETMGRKLKVSMGKDILSAQHNLSKSYAVKELEETKLIAGYICKKVEISAPQLFEPTIIYYTSEIKTPNFSSPYPFLNGFPMEYSVNIAGSVQKYSVISVQKERISKKTFKIPSGYTETSIEALQKMALGMEADF